MVWVPPSEVMCSRAFSRCCLFVERMKRKRTHRYLCTSYRFAWVFFTRGTNGEALHPRLSLLAFVGWPKQEVALAPQCEGSQSPYCKLKNIYFVNFLSCLKKFYLTLRSEFIEFLLPDDVRFSFWIFLQRSGAAYSLRRLTNWHYFFFIKIQ